MMGKVTNAAYAQARLEKRSKLVKYQDLGTFFPRDASRNRGLMRGGPAAVTARPEWHYLTGAFSPSCVWIKLTWI
jgi:hypothetical protein